MNQNRLFCPLYILYKTERANKISTLSSGKAVFTTTFDIGITDDVTYQQQILDCLGLQDVNTTDFNYGSWIATAGFNDVRAIATFLNSPSDTNNPYGPTNCGNPAAQEFAMAAMEALENNLIDSIGDIPVVTPPNAADIVDMLECFDLNQDATVTIYVEQPLPGSPTTSYLLNPGHTFVSIEQGTNIAVFGYYPEEGVNPLTGDIEDSGIIADNAGHEYDVSISTSISADQLTDIIAYSIDAPETYNLNTYNCSDFGIEIGNISGLELPDADGTWINGGGSNPGVLGEYIRNLPNSLDYNTNTTSGVAPENNKDC